jgi:hypothetical protein
MAFHSKTTSALAMADPNNRVAINMYRLKVLFLLGRPRMVFIVLPPDSSMASYQQ